MKNRFPDLVFHGEKLTDVLTVLGWLALAWWAGCESGTSAGHRSGVCDEKCHAHSEVVEQVPLTCLCPTDRVVVVKAGKR